MTPQYISKTPQYIFREIVQQFVLSFNFFICFVELMIVTKMHNIYFDELETLNLMGMAFA